MSPHRALALGQGRLPGGRLVQPSEEGGRSTAWGVGQAQPEPARACFSFLPIASLWPHCGLAVASDLPATGAAGALREWGYVLNTQPCPGVLAQPRSHVHQRDPWTLSSEMPPLTSCRPPAPFLCGWLRPCCVAVCQVGAWAWGMPCPYPSTGSPLRLFFVRCLCLSQAGVGLDIPRGCSLSAGGKWHRRGLGAPHSARPFSRPQAAGPKLATGPDGGSRGDKNRREHLETCSHCSCLYVLPQQGSGGRGRQGGI